VELGLGGKVAVVAASSKGLGKASALALAGEGARVTICARSEQELAAAAEEIRAATGAEVLSVSADLTTADGIQRVVAATVERFGGVDVLVNNSGGPAPGKLQSLTDDDWRHGFEVVTLNLFASSARSCPTCVPRGGAGSSGSSPARSRSRWPTWTCPTGSARAWPGGADDATIQAHVAAAIPLGRLGEPAEVGQLVAFLASERAGYITGAVYQIDGGIIRSNL
jgi:3-oxoacyl-[acyl-carrier protein] reductase